jgi:hypothetical protein
MIATIAGFIGVPKWAIIAGLVALAVAGAGLGKCAYDRSIISAHEAKRELGQERADRKADAAVAETRRGDDARLTQETQELERSRTNAQTDIDRRLARHRCLRLQQAARSDGKLAPACP